MNDDFVELVRGISQCWEGAILEGRMMRFVPGDGSRDEEVEPGSANENESGIVDWCLPAMPIAKEEKPQVGSVGVELTSIHRCMLYCSWSGSGAGKASVARLGAVGS
jgi:hypothetical protein